MLGNKLIGIRNNVLRSNFFILSIVCILPIRTLGQKDFFQPSSSENPGRIRGVIISEALVGTAITIGLDYLWYRKFPHSRFHLFNDNAEWLNMDKVGHATTAYNIAVIQSDIFQWAGVKAVPAAAIGTFTALGFMSMIEILDGRSAKWGFSIGDMLANLSGCLLYQGQQWMWNEQRIGLKFSYHYTIYAQYYPQELGANRSERIIKDYNGQTYWLSCNIASFLSSRSNFPKWINATVGYGAEGMIGARDNPKQLNGKNIPDFKRYRQFYFSFDTDLYRVQNVSEFADMLLKVNRTLKIPAPAMEWDGEQGVKLHLLYY